MLVLQYKHEAPAPPSVWRHVPRPLIRCIYLVGGFYLSLAGFSLPNFAHQSLVYSLFLCAITSMKHLVTSMNGLHFSNSSPHQMPVTVEPHLTILMGNTNVIALRQWEQTWTTSDTELKTALKQTLTYSVWLQDCHWTWRRKSLLRWWASMGL